MKDWKEVIALFIAAVFIFSTSLFIGEASFANGKFSLENPFGFGVYIIAMCAGLPALRNIISR